MSRRSIMLLLILATAIITAGITAYYLYRPNAPRVNKFRQWMRDPAAHPDWKLAAGSQCNSAPFLFPTDGFAGFLWGDSFGLRHTHQGIDVFAGTDAGLTKVIAAYPNGSPRSLYACRTTRFKVEGRSGFTIPIWQIKMATHSSRMISLPAHLKNSLRLVHSWVIRA